MKSSTPRRRSRRPIAPQRPPGRQTLVEPLENRLLMATTRLLGLDVSYYQGSAQGSGVSINWTSVKNAGKSFAFIRASYGVNSVDDDFTRNAPQALNAGLYVGYYHYAYYDSSGHTPTNEADHYWSTIAPYMAADGKHLMPFLDVEEGTGVADGETLTAWCDNFCLRLQQDAAKAGFSIVPLIYCSSSPAGSYFAPATNVPDPAQLYPIDVANYPGSPNYTTGDPPAGTGDWQDWQMWQYTSSGSVSGISGNVDLDVLNGDVNNLKNYFVQAWAVGAQVTARPQPTTYSTSHALPTAVKVYATATTRAANDSYQLVDAYTGGTIIAKGSSTDGDGNQRWLATFSNGVTGWIVQDANYVVQNMDGRWPVGSYVTSRTVTGQIIQGPLYSNGVQRWQVQFNNGITGWDDEELLTTATPSIASPSPASSTTAYLTSLPANFTWTGTNATSYDVYLDNVKRATVDTNSWSPPSLADGTHTWYVIGHNAELSKTGSTWTFNLDTAAPVVTYGGQAPALGDSTLTFTATYADATSGVQVGSLGTGDVVVTGPSGYSQVATFLSVDVGTNGSPRTVTYSVPAPGGSWDATDNGLYTVSQVAGQVRDVAGNYAPDGAIGTFSANLPFAYVDGTTLHAVFVAPGPIILTGDSGGHVTATQGSDSYTFDTAGLTGILVTTTSGNDALFIAGSVPPPITFTGPSGGNDSVVLGSGAAATIASDAAGDAVTVGDGGNLTLAVPQHLASLALNGGTAVLPAGGADPLDTAGLSIATGGVLQLNDNSLVWDYAGGASPADALRQFLYNGRNGGSWDGTGGITTSAATGIGYLEASDLGVDTWAGVQVDDTALLVKPTPAGDVNLDGRVNADDYALTDRGFARNPADPHWLDGDFDYDGALTGGDYLLLDTTSLGTGTPSPSLLAAREAAFGPAYVDALTVALSPEPGTTTTPDDPGSPFSADPIIDTLIPVPPAAAVTAADPASSEPAPAAPVAVIHGPNKVRRHKHARFTFSVAGITPPPTTAGQFTYHVDWNGDGVVDQTVAGGASLSLGHRFARPGRHTIAAWIADDATGLSGDASSFSFRVL